MLCCVSRKSVEGSGFKRPPLVPPRGLSLTNSAGKSTVSSTSLKDTSESKCLTTFLNSNCKLNNIIEEDEPPVLLPCTICGRTFKQQSLEKHTRICERSATKKRKPFDSAKQRIQGTELEEFLPKESKRRIFIEEKSTSWKQTHDEFIKTIRAARGDTVEAPPSRQSAPIVAPGPPTRANEKGICPTCNRQFGIKAYDRHVAWCKERVTRMPSSPATNMAKERLDARMKYRAPALKNRRMTNREKYSSSSKNTAINSKTKETVSLPSCIKSAESNSPVGLKQQRKIGTGRSDGIMPPGPVKSRLSDRSNNRSINDDPLSPTLLPPLLIRPHTPERRESLIATNYHTKIPKKSQKTNIVTSRSHGNPKVNDVTVNADVIGMTVLACNDEKVSSELITWKQLASSQASKLDEDDGEREWMKSIGKLDETFSIEESVDAQFNAGRRDLRVSGINAEDITRASTPIEQLNQGGENSSSDEHENDEKRSEALPPKPVNLLETSTIIPIARIRLSDDITNDSLDSAKSSEIVLRRRLRRKMNLLRESTDSLVSSFESLDNVPTKDSRFPDIHVDRRGTFHQGRRKVSYWERAIRNSKSRFVTLAQRRETPKSSIVLPPVVSVHRRTSEPDKRPAWSKYIHRRPDFNLVLKGRTGISADYDPFLLAERQMLDLLSDTCSDKSFPDSPITQTKPTSPNYPLTHSSAFVKYPNHINLDNLKPEKRASLIAPPMEFDDLSTGFSSDSTETNSIARELFGERNQTNKSGTILGRRVIIDKSKALGQVSDVFGEAIDTKCRDDTRNEKNSIKVDKSTPKASRPMMNRSNSVRASSAPKIPDRNNSATGGNRNNNRSISGNGFNRNNNNYGSNLSLSSIVSSEIEVKRTNSVFEDLVSSFEDDVSGSFPSLRSLLKNDSLSSTIQGNRNGQMSDEELSSPDSYNKKDNKLSGDSAYSSLNRKYFNGRSTNDVAGKVDEETAARHRDHEITPSLKSKMSKFCHECGTKFPETAKFCCECGIQRLAL